MTDQHHGATCLAPLRKLLPEQEEPFGIQRSFCFVEQQQPGIGQRQTRQQTTL